MSEFNSRMRSILLEERMKLTENITLEQMRFEELIHQHEGGDSMDEVAITIDKNILERLWANMSMGVYKIDAALARMANGTYGVCTKCGRMIDKDRLEAIPEAPLCIDCQRALASNHRQRL
jgi:DnaK suppressor protein